MHQYYPSDPFLNAQTVYYCASEDSVVVCWVVPGTLSLED